MGALSRRPGLGSGPDVGDSMVVCAGKGPGRAFGLRLSSTEGSRRVGGSLFQYLWSAVLAGRLWGDCSIRHPGAAWGAAHRLWRWEPIEELHLYRRRGTGHTARGVTRRGNRRDVQCWIEG